MTGDEATTTTTGCVTRFVLAIVPVILLSMACSSRTGNSTTVVFDNKPVSQLITISKLDPCLDCPVVTSGRLLVRVPLYQQSATANHSSSEDRVVGPVVILFNTIRSSPPLQCEFGTAIHSFIHSATQGLCHGHFLSFVFSILPKFSHRKKPPLSSPSSLGTRPLITGVDAWGLSLFAFSRKRRMYVVTIVQSSLKQ